MRKGLLLVALVALVFASDAAEAETTSLVREEARHVLEQVPDLALSLPAGDDVRLSSLWSEKPLLVTLFYQRCTGACSPFLRSLGHAVERVGGLGDTYRIVSVSFDADDTAARVGELAEALDVGAPGAWLLGVSSPDEVKALSDAIGYSYERIAGTSQFDHPSLVAAVRDGRIVRVLWGNTVSVPRFRELVMELRGTHVPFYTDPDAKTRFRCLDVDDRGEVRLGTGLLVLLLPACVALLVAISVFARPFRNQARTRGTET